MTATHEVDTIGQLDAVERSVIATPDGPMISATSRISQSYPTTVEDLWDACTNPERLPRWFGPVSGDLRAGGRFEVEDNASGTIQTCTAPTGFTTSWEFNGAATQLAISIEPDGDGRARLTLEHSGVLPRELWAQFGPGATGIGWDLGMLGLAHHLATGSETPAEHGPWGQSDAAKAFMADSSRRWADASIAAGTPEAEARAAEATTTAFFAGG